MPIKDCVGMSEATAEKQYVLRMILIAHTKIIGKILARHPLYAYQSYCYYDLNAGWAVHDDGTEGSPSIFAGVLRNSGLPGEACLFENGKKALPMLRRFCEGRTDFRLFPVSNHKLLAKVPEVTDEKHRYGMVYVDPNGIPMKAPILGEFLQRDYMRKLDVLLHVPAGTNKRVHGCFGETIAQRLCNYIDSVGRVYWIIREPCGDHGKQWTFLLGTNWDALDDFKRLGFHRITGPEGERILYELSYSDKERTLRELQGIPCPPPLPARANSSDAAQQGPVRSLQASPPNGTTPLTLPGLGDV